MFEGGLAAPHMRVCAIQIYVAFMAAVAAMCPLFLDWYELGNADWVGLASLVILGILSESAAISVKVASSVGHSSITFIPFLASMLLFGPAAGVLSAISIKVVGEFILHEKPLRKRIFNVAQWTIAGTLTGLVFLSTATAMGLDPGDFNSMLSGGAVLIPFAASILTLFAVNYLSVAGAIALDKGLSFSRVVQLLAGSTGANLLYGVLIGPIAVVVAVLYVQLGVAGIFFALLPLMFIRRSYLTNINLAKANRDLLKALVKAIETRDPYTSGHSLRVSTLARRIAINLGLSQKRVEEVETAALLHDIGKIEAVYTEILMKPDSLSEDERKMIESHVTKGVELLQSISSFPSSVIAAVRHHHEREDGKGYPDRLYGAQIPLGAKIIKVCDAIDAMLSDRPYRSALSLPQVREQLITYAGTQFDVETVSCVVKGDLLETHRDEVEASKEWSPAMVIEHDLTPPRSREPTLPASVRTLLGSLRSPPGRRTDQDVHSTN